MQYKFTMEQGDLLMIDYMCLLLPGVLAVWIYEKLTKQDLKIKSWLVFYGVNVLLINFACMMIMRLVLGRAAEYLSGFYVYTATNYLILAIPAAVCSGVLFALFAKKTEIVLEENADEEA